MPRDYKYNKQIKDFELEEIQFKGIALTDSLKKKIVIDILPGL
jgi:hypothetical protein